MFLKRYLMVVFQACYTPGCRLVCMRATCGPHTSGLWNEFDSKLLIHAKLHIEGFYIFGPSAVTSSRLRCCLWYRGGSCNIQWQLCYTFCSLFCLPAGRCKFLFLISLIALNGKFSLMWNFLCAGNDYGPKRAASSAANAKSRKLNEWRVLSFALAPPSRNGKA